MERRQRAVRKLKAHPKVSRQLAGGTGVYAYGQREQQRCLRGANSERKGTLDEELGETNRLATKERKKKKVSHGHSSKHDHVHSHLTRNVHNSLTLCVDKKKKKEELGMLGSSQCTNSFH